MDPQATLTQCDQAISECRRFDARDLLSAYREWRRKGGFEPHNVASSGKSGDVFANDCARRIDDQAVQERTTNHMRNLGTPDDVRTLEDMVDRIGLREVLGALDAVCGEKADHLTTNWQDAVTAKLWLAAGRTIARAERSVAVAAVSR